MGKELQNKLRKMANAAESVLDDMLDEIENETEKEGK